MIAFSNRVTLKKNEIAPGIFLMEKEDLMPCNPKDIEIGYYFLNDKALTIGHQYNHDESVARIISHSKRIGRWVGVMQDVIEEEMEKNLADEKTLRENSANFDELKSIASYFKNLLCLFTGEARKKPHANLEVPFSGIYKQGVGYIRRGIAGLVNRGLVQGVYEPKKSPFLDILFPTPLLIGLIMQSQGVKPRNFS
jgi:hypothetical protein